MDQELLELVDHAVRVLEELGIPYAIGGSVATLAYGEDRGTRDLDVVILLDEADVPKLLKAFPFPDFYSDAGTAREAIRTGGTFNVIYGRAKVVSSPQPGPSNATRSNAQNGCGPWVAAWRRCPRPRN